MSGVEDWLLFDVTLLEKKMAVMCKQRVREGSRRTENRGRKYGC